MWQEPGLVWMAAGLALFAITLVINFAASAVVARSRSGAESDA